MKDPEPLRVLFVEDRPDDAELVRLALDRAGYAVEWERVETRETMTAALDRGRWDVVIADYRLPHFSGPAALGVCQERGLDVPFIIVSGTVGEEEAVGALKAGAHDFVGKMNLTRLGPAVSRELREAAGRRAQRRAEEALRRAEAQYRQLVESVRAIVWRCEVETFQLTFVNAEAELILGFPRHLWLQSDFWAQRHHPDDLEAAAAARRQAVQHGGGQHEYRMIAADGHVVWFQEFMNTLPGPNGPPELAGVTVDVSERKKLEEQLQRGQRLEALGRLAGGIAHDFNNILGVIIGYADLARRDLPPDHPARPRVLQIQGAADRAANLTRQLLAFSRRQAMQARTVELNSVVTGLEEMLRRLIGEDIELLLGLSSSLWPVRADPGQLEQVLLNLVLNARDAMPHGGILVIETSNVRVDEVYVRSHGVGRPGEYVMMAVTDNGQGMDAETQRHIFEPFFTTKGPGEGTGLGLAVVYGIVEQSGGHIGVYSEPGHGTTFKLYLPHALEEVETAPALPSRSAASPQGTETILLVEDETTLRNLIAEVLGQAGYSVLEARHGGEAARLADFHEGPIHLLLTDVIMPGATGREVVDAVVARRPDTRFLYISGHPRDVFEHASQMGAHVFLQKPFTADTLLQAVREVLDGVTEAGRP